MNSRPLDPQRFFGVDAAIRKIAKSPILAPLNGVLLSLSDALFHYIFSRSGMRSGTVEKMPLPLDEESRDKRIALFQENPEIIIPYSKITVKFS